MKLPCHVSPYHSHNFSCNKTSFYVGIVMRKQTTEQFVIRDIYVPVVLKFIHDTPIAGHQGGERTPQAADTVHYWPTMRKDMANYAARYISCEEHQGSAKERSRYFNTKHLSNLRTLSQKIFFIWQEANMARSIFWFAYTVLNVSWFLHQSKVKQLQVQHIH